MAKQLTFSEEARRDLKVGVDALAGQDLGGTRLQRVAVVLHDEILELGIPVGVEVLLADEEPRLAQQKTSLLELVSADVALVKNRVGCAAFS